MGTDQVNIRVRVRSPHKYSQDDISECTELCIEVMRRHRLRLLRFEFDAQKQQARVSTVPNLHAYEQEAFSATMKQIHEHLPIDGMTIDLGEHAMALAESNAIEVLLDPCSD